MSGHPLLAIHPASRGIGWIVFDKPRSAFDWGTIHGYGSENAQKRIGVLCKRFRPQLLVLEAFEHPGSRRGTRTRQLCRTIVQVAEGSQLAVRQVSMEELHAVFGMTMHKEIALRVAEEIEALQPRLPPPKPIWVGESLNMALFRAAACALTVYAEHA